MHEINRRGVALLAATPFHSKSNARPGVHLLQPALIDAVGKPRHGVVRDDVDCLEENLYRRTSHAADPQGQVLLRNTEANCERLLAADQRCCVFEGMKFSRGHAWQLSSPVVQGIDLAQCALCRRGLEIR